MLLNNQIDKHKMLLLNMLTLQEELNIATNGSEYKLGFTEHGDKISWTRCIVMEAFELASFTKWRHWEDIEGTIDWHNIQIEIIDILHFVLSYLLQHVNIDDIIDDVVILSNYDISNFPDVTSIRDESENLIYYTLMVQNNDDIDSKNAAHIILSKFFLLAQFAAIAFEDLYKIYVAKNRLNLFKQNNGYKEGTYSKIWGDKKDSEVMFEMLKDIQGDIDKNNFYEKLNLTYIKTSKA